MDKIKKKKPTLADVRPGGSARLADFNSLPTKQLENLQAYGLTPGQRIQVRQQKPVTVVIIDNTELAIEFDIACNIQVKDLEPDDRRSLPKPKFWGK